MSLNNLGIIQHELREYEAAKQSYGEGKKAMEVLSESGKKYPLAKVGLNGAPNEVYFESDEIVEPH